MVKISVPLLTTLILLLVSVLVIVLADDYYEILEISRQASEREIRKAFKKKALQFHPDKNQDDPEAQSKFIKINRAYEVLKDEELRKKYDLHGEKGLDDSGSHGSNYHSWSYYRDNFGIYDDDIEIITLNNADFDQSVLGSEDVWFINFYHPMCSHCHTLAPVWRKVAQELDGVIRIGAVNCDDNYYVCSSQGIRSYPTLIAYPGRELFMGEKVREELIDFILKKLNPSPFIPLVSSKWKSEVENCEDKSWLVVPKPEFDDDEDFTITKIKLGAVFENLLCLAEVECSKSPKICSALDVKKEARFFQAKEQLLKGKGEDLQSTNPQELSKEVLALLPEVPYMSYEEYMDMRRNLKSEKDAVPWLVIFTDQNDDRNLELRKLTAYLPSFNVGRVKCKELKGECDDLFISKTPAFALFKIGGGYEMHQGRNLAHDIAVFARESSMATHFQILTPKQFPQVLSDGSPWFVDFYAPWCPPCMKLLPEFRKASRLLDIPVKFGSIDCTTHTHLCQRFNIHQYPTTILYNETVPHHYLGYHSASELIDFVKDTLHPTVIVLDDKLFEERIRTKPSNQLWVVDYYANWCGHCIEMAPEYRRFARLTSKLSGVFVAQIDCAIYRHICQREGVNGYPTVRLYPMGFTGTIRQITYDEWSRDADSFNQWVHRFLPSKVTVLDDRTFEEMLRDSEPWLVDFYAPWCGHCHHFAPHFESIAVELEGQMGFGKVDCDTHRWLCRNAGVRAYPTVVFYKGVQRGETRQNIQGYDLNTLIKDEIVSILNQLLQKRRISTMHDEL